MNEAIVNHQTHAISSVPTTSLFDVLHNSLILANTVPYLPVSGLLHLASTNQAFRRLLYKTPGVFRHLDLTQVKAAQFHLDEIDRGGQVWRNVQLDEYLTEDDFYSGPLRGVLSTLQRRNLLQDVQTLILDGISVTSDLCHELINDPIYSVRILSLRDVKNLNQAKLRAALMYACRSTRPEGMPRLKALYFFGSKEAVPASAAHPGCQSIGSDWNQKSQQALTSSLQKEADAWWSKKGKMVTRPITADWAQCMLACEGLIAFDTVVCRGPRHRNSPAFGNPALAYSNEPAVATYALRGCAGCGKAPEGTIDFDSDVLALRPLLSPPPILSSSLRAATTPHHPEGSFVARCVDCLRDRYCAQCHEWWCESCHQLIGQSGQAYQVTIVDDDDSSGDALDPVEVELATFKAKARVSRSCWECGNNCDPCIEKTQRVCQKCYGGYCIIHNEGSSTKFCDCEYLGILDRLLFALASGLLTGRQGVLVEVEASGDFDAILTNLHLSRLAEHKRKALKKQRRHL